MTKDLNIFSCVYWPFIFFGEMSSITLPVFKIHSTPSICMSTLIKMVSVPRHLNYNSFVLTFKIEDKSINFVLSTLFLAILSLFHFHVTFRIVLSISTKKGSKNFERNCTESIYTVFLILLYT